VAIVGVGLAAAGTVCVSVGTIDAETVGVRVAVTDGVTDAVLVVVHVGVSGPSNAVKVAVWVGASVGLLVGCAVGVRVGVSERPLVADGAGGKVAVTLGRDVYVAVAGAVRRELSPPHPANTSTVNRAVEHAV